MARPSSGCEPCTEAWAMRRPWPKWMQRSDASRHARSDETRRMTRSRWPALAAAVMLILAAATGSAATQAGARAPTDESPSATRQRFLEMFGRAYFPRRTGQLLVVPKQGDFITRPDPYYVQMHGTPWPYDVDIPLMFVGPAVKTGLYSMVAVQQDVAPTLAAALGVQMPPTA